MLLDLLVFLYWLIQFQNHFSSINKSKTLLTGKSWFMKNIYLVHKTNSIKQLMILLYLT